MMAIRIVGGTEYIRLFRQRLQRCLHGFLRYSNTAQRDGGHFPRLGRFIFSLQRVLDRGRFYRPIVLGLLFGGRVQLGAHCVASHLRGTIDGYARRAKFKTTMS